MTKILRDFSQESAGSIPSYLTAQVLSDGAFDISEIASAVRLRFTGDTSRADNFARENQHAAPNTREGEPEEVVASIMTDSSPAVGGIHIGLFTRHQVSAQTFYLATISATASNGFIRMGKRVAGTFTNIGGDQSFAWSANTLYRMRFRVSGTTTVTLQCKVWPDGDAEPGSWTFTATDTSGSRIESAGEMGAYCNQVEGAVRSWGWLGTAVNDTAPMIDDDPDLPPQGTVTISNVDPGVTTAEITYSYDDTDQTGFEYRIDNGTAASIGASPATITGLAENTTYDSPGIQVRAINANGAGDWSTAATFSTDPAVAAVKGVRVTLYDENRNALANLTDITARWFDSPTGATQLLHTNTASTDGSGLLELNIDATTTLSLDDVGALHLYKQGATPDDDLQVIRRLSVMDIANG